MQTKLQLETRDYDSFFEENYHVLRNLALRITKNNYDDSEDLLHDFYLKLANFKPAKKPQNIKAYLFIALRNSYRSVLRKKKLVENIMSFDNDNLLNLLFDDQAVKNLKFEEQLREICQYACLRKKTSISGSVVILRYFHGYYPSEVCRVIRRSQNAVEARLAVARREISQYLINPALMQFDLTAENSEKTGEKNAKGVKDLLTELRRQIYSTKHGECLLEDEYYHLYRISKKPLTREVLSHVVSCAQCLSYVNRILKLPSLVERHPLDSLRETAFGYLLVFYLAIEPLVGQFLSESQQLSAFSNIL